MTCYGGTPSQLSLVFRVALVSSPRRIPERSPETGDSIRVGPTCFRSLRVQVITLGGVKTGVTEEMAIDKYAYNRYSQKMAQAVFHPSGDGLLTAAFNRYSMAKTPQTDSSFSAQPATPHTHSFLAEQPGHYIRRLQQIAVGMFLEENRAFDITPVQFAALMTISERPGVDQKTLAAAIGFDAATIGGVVDRLKQRGLLQRRAGDRDRRVRQLLLTRAGETLVTRMRPLVRKVQRRLLAPLREAERREFSRMLRVLVEANNEFSRAPRKG